MTASVNNCCGDFDSCYLPCEVRRVVAFSTSPAPRAKFAGRAPMASNELALPVLPPPVRMRRVPLLERLIAGPQGDPTLRDDFFSFLGCLACGIGIALVLLAIIIAGRVLVGGAQ